MAKCNLGKVNLARFAHDLWGCPFGVRRGKPHTALLSSDRCNQCFCERIFADSLASPFPEGYLTSEVSIGLGKFFHWTSFSVTVPVSGCYWGGSRLLGCHGDFPAVPGLPRALPH